MEERLDELRQLNEKIVQLWEGGDLEAAHPKAEHAYDLAKQIERDDDGSSSDRLGLIKLMRGTTSSNLARISVLTGGFSKSRKLIDESIKLLEDRGRGDSFDMATTLLNYGALLNNVGRFQDAERFIKRSIDIFESDKYRDIQSEFFLKLRSVGMSHIGHSYDRLSRYDEAERFYEKSYQLALKIHKNRLYQSSGTEGYPELINALTDLGRQKITLGKFDKAADLLSDALDLSNRYQNNHLYYRSLLEALMLLYRRTGDEVTSQKFAKAMITESNKTFGKNSLYSAFAKLAFANSLAAESRLKEADVLLTDAKQTVEKLLGGEHPALSIILASLGKTKLRLGKVVKAEELLSNALRLTVDNRLNVRRQLQVDLLGRRSVNIDLSQLFYDYLEVTDHFSNREGNEKNIIGKALYFAQAIQNSSTATAIANMSARLAAGNAELSEIIRERDAAWDRWAALDRRLQLARALSDENRNAVREKILKNNSENEVKRIKHYDNEISEKFKRFQEFAVPNPLSVSEIQELLEDDELLLLPLASTNRNLQSKKVMVWSITKNEIALEKSETSLKDLAVEVEALRCGLDRTGWEGMAKLCSKLLGIDIGMAPLDGDPLPFDPWRAYRLYQGLFGGIAPAIGDRKIILVPTGPLTQIPPQVFVTEPPSDFKEEKLNYESVKWLIDGNSVVILPSITALRSLRASDAKPSGAAKSYIGFGNPLLDGGNGDAKAAKQARKFNHCQIEQLKTAVDSRKARGVLPIRIEDELANVEVIRKQSPLPDTAVELCSVAGNLDSSGENVYLAEHATESNLKRLNGNDEGDRELEKYRILHFATHGAVAGELDGFSEPGLIFTPPVFATDRDDGYLNSSEIAELRLDADWVILSACNTASGSSRNANALSGIASAFFYAGARSVLVSHWYVKSSAATEIVTYLSRPQKSNHRPDALRSAMRNLIGSNNYKSHPEYWAPFVLVGLGTPGL